MTAILFLFVTLVAVGLFYAATGKNKRLLLVLLIWLAIVGVCAEAGLFQTNPKRFVVVILTVLVLTVLGFYRVRNERTNALLLLSIHTVRFPVELVLFQLYQQKKIPLLMTYAGWNFDIVIGLSAMAFVMYQLVTKRSINRSLFIMWNYLGLLLLTTIVVLAMLSSPLPIQQLAFDQPNVAILEFPYAFLPAIVVPLVYLSHFLLLRRIT